VPAHAPVTPTHTTATATDRRSERRTPVGETVFLCIASAHFLLYAGFILGGIVYTEWERVLPPQANHVIMTSLAVVEVAAIILLVDAKRRIADHKSRVRHDDQFTILSAQYTAIREALSERREAEERTVPLAGTTQRVIYAASATVAAVHTRRDEEELESRVEDRVLRRLEGRIDEARKQGEWSGYAKCANDGLAGVGGEVRTLPSARNGHPAP
jgi:hypothetical protein